MVAGWCGVSIKDEECTPLVITKDNLNAKDCTTIQQLIEARPGKKKGETMKFAPKIVDESRKRTAAADCG